MIKRTIEPQVLNLAKKYPVVSITGPRQSGKTTLAKKIFKDYEYVNLENLDVLQMARKDAKGFLKIGSKQKMIIDEVQKLPELLSYIQAEVDEQDIAGQYVVTGSQQFGLSEKISQSLAGRAANFVLLPLSIRELVKTSTNTSHWQLMQTGFYPRIYDKKIKSRDFYRDYLFTYVERDVRQIKNIGSLSSFQRFLQLLAGRAGQLVNLSGLASDTGVSYKTVESWLSVLEASYLVFRLEPFYENFSKRLIKSPKVYFYDTGLLCYLLGLDQVEKLKTHYLQGQIFENLVIAEVKKAIFNRLSGEKVYFWRDNNQNEVDLIIDEGDVRQAVEIKIGQTFAIDWLKGLKFWQKLPHKVKTRGQLVYTGSKEIRLNQFKIANWLDWLLG